MRRNNLEDKIKFWLSGREDIRKAPPEILAFIYSACNPPKKKKTGAPIQEPQIKQGSNEEIPASKSRGKRKGIDPFNQL